ncbi:TonB-dependent receptor [Emcibacter nanhaiensis]|uniref:TonB-dependent receptor n=1 Tax=Emcibacter nanhaiensis TaxID=1505037 RepID=UPI0015E368CA|nr:TonB-dependent receptor [Emcibacter nanhaiensis]
MLTTASTLALPVQVQAREDEDFILPEIVVTAQKRQENIQDVPISITAFSSEDLLDRSIVNLTDMAKATPNLSFLSDGTLKNTAPSIRGVFSPGAAQAGIDTPMATYVDEVYMGTTVGQNFALYDIERIEVLRGPQGTLFGRNALSGLMNVVTPVPGESREGYAEATYGNYNLVRLRAGLSGPLVDGKLSGSLSASFTDRDGYVTNRFTGNDVNDEGNWGIRGKLLITPRDTVEIILSADYREVDQSTRTYDIAGFNTVPGTLFAPTGPAEVDDDPFDRNISQDFEGQETLEEFGTSATINIGFEGVSFKSISAYRTHDYFQSYDADNTEIAVTVRETPEDMDSFFQELRLTSDPGGKIDWIVGFNYYYQKTANEFASILNNETLVEDRLLSTLLPPAAIGVDQPTLDYLFSIGLLEAPDTLAALQFFGALTPPFGETRSTGTTTLNSYAGYANAVYHMTDRLNVNIGLRYTAEDKDFAYEQTSTSGNIFFGLPEIPAFEDHKSFESFTPAFGFDYDLSDTAMVYGKAARGFKSGGFNDGFTSNSDAAFGEETLWNYEIGSKSTFLKGRMQVNLAGYLMTWKNVQNIFSDVPDGSVIPFFQVDTAGDIEIKGVELETIFQVTPELQARASLGIVDAKFTSVSDRLADLGGAVGDPVENVPNFTISGGLTYTLELGNSGTLTISGNVEHRDDTPLTTVRTGVPNVQPAYTLFDAALIYKTASENLTVQFWAKNITNKKYVTALFDVDNNAASPIGAAYHSVGIPRTYGLTARYAF